MRYLLFFFISFFLSGCIKEQPKVAWLVIDKWDFTANQNAKEPQGELTHNFSQVFLTMDGKSLGVYELPAKIPIITNDGPHNFIMMPGIINNGISKTKKRYPFVEQFSQTISLKLEDTAFVTPVTKYYSSLNFLIEDFESPSMQIEVNEASAAKLIRSDNPDILKWGSKYGDIQLNVTDTLISFVTTFQKVLPKLGSEVYLEFDYMNTNSTLISILSYGNGDYFVDPYLFITSQKNENAVWKHAYVDLKENISYRQTTPINEVEFQFAIDKNEISTFFYIDNIKIIYP